MKAWLGLEKLLLRWLTHRELVVPLYRCSNDVDQLSLRRHSPRWNKALSFKSQRLGSLTLSFPIGYTFLLYSVREETT